MSSGASARQVVNGGAPVRMEPNRDTRVSEAYKLGAQVSGASGKSAREVIKAGTPTRVNQPGSKGTGS